MSRGPAISVRDRAIIWDYIARGITYPKQVFEAFDEMGERIISLDSIRKLTKEYEHFKRLLPEYPALQRDLAASGVVRSLVEEKLKEHLAKVVDYLKKWKEETIISHPAQVNYTKRVELEPWFPRFEKDFPSERKIDEDRFFAKGVKSHYKGTPLEAKAEKLGETEKSYVETCAELLDAICERIKYAGVKFSFSRSHDELGVLEYYPIEIQKRVLADYPGSVPSSHEYSIQPCQARKNSRQIEAKLLKLEAIPLGLAETEEELRRFTDIHVGLIEQFRDSRQTQNVGEIYGKVKNKLHEFQEEIEDEILRGMPGGKCPYCPV